MATKKVTKKTLRSQYIESLHSIGIDGDRPEIELSDCNIVSFRFKNMSDANSFHYDLMSNKIPYVLYDGAIEDVVVIIKKEDGLVSEIVSLAKNNNGEEYNVKID